MCMQCESPYDKCAYRTQKATPCKRLNLNGTQSFLLPRNPKSFMLPVCISELNGMVRKCVLGVRKDDVVKIEA